MPKKNIYLLLLTVVFLLIVGIKVTTKSNSEEDFEEKTAERNSPEEGSQDPSHLVRSPELRQTRGASNDDFDLRLEALDHEALIAETKTERKNGRQIFAKARIVNAAPHLSGHWRAEGDVAKWDFTLQSQGAESLNLAFKEFKLPPGSTLTISDPTGEAEAITFTDRDNDDHGELWTPIFKTDQLHLALNLPRQLAPDLKLRLSQVNHGFRSLSSLQKRDFKEIGDSASGDCNIDVVCSAADNADFGPLVDMYRDQIRSVGAYTLGGVETCSGALINNTQNDRTPYFLTAFHCGITPGNAASVVVYWNFENTFCRQPGTSASGQDGDGPVTQFNTGSTYRAARENTDFCLIELDDPVDANTRPFYAGWDRSGVNPSMSFAVHHPSVSEKRISFELNSTRITNEFDDAVNSSGTHFRVGDWDFGTTEGGSSGSPLFDSAGRIIGQLEGGSAACGNNLPDWYGRLSRSWENATSTSERLSNWLDPANTNLIQLDGTNFDELLSIAAGSITEGDTGVTTLEATVTLSPPADETVTVTVFAQNITAFAGSDFSAVNEEITFLPGETSKTVTVNVMGDTEAEENEVFNLLLVRATNAQASRTPAVVTILNDDFITPEISDLTTASAMVNGAFEYQIQAINTPTSYRILNGPEGMAIDALTGIVTWIPLSVGTFSVDVVAVNPAGEDMQTLTIQVEGNDLIEALDYVGPASLTNGNPGWFSQTSVTKDGVDAARSGALGDNGSSRMTLQITGPERLGFWWRCSSEEGFDFLSLELNENPFPGVTPISGEQDWSYVFVDIPVGEHAVSWVYQKDLSNSAGQDTAWVDDIRTRSGALPVVFTNTEHTVIVGQEARLPMEFVNTTSQVFQVLPPWLVFDTENSELVGTPPDARITSFIVLGTGQSSSDRRDLTITAVASNTIIPPAIEQPNLLVIDGVGDQWITDSIAGAVGGVAARSGRISDLEQSSMSLNVQGPGELIFSWMVASERSFDFLEYSHNGIVGGRISGSTEWRDVTITLAPGQNEIRWRYFKDFSVSASGDYGAVDNIRLGGYAAFLSQNSLSHYSSRSTDDEDGDGLSLFAEYAFAGDLTQPDSRQILGISAQAESPDFLELVFSGLNNPSDVRYTLESSPDLSPNSWTVQSVTPEVTPASDGATYRYQDIEPQSGNEKLFYRVRAGFQ